MLSQAEHDELAATLCITCSPNLATKIRRRSKSSYAKPNSERLPIKSLRNYGAIIVTENLREAVRIGNEIAPEHLELLVRQPENGALEIRNAGAIS